MIRTVLFDCDSTLSAVEGIDQLARRAGVEAEIAPLTRAAMEGRLALQEIYQRRLQIIKPTRTEVDWLGREYIAHVVPGAADVLHALRQSGRAAHIISGGLKPAVSMLAEYLGIPAINVHAVDIHFDARGAYAGYDESSPLAQAGGKAEICRRLPLIPEQAVMVGDGVTDLEAAEAGIVVIGFGGVVRRDAVVARATVFIEGPSLLPVLDVILAGREHLPAPGKAK